MPSFRTRRAHRAVREAIQDIFFAKIRGDGSAVLGRSRWRHGDGVVQ